MVGAGFSRNADPLSSTAQPMPGWAQMAEALCHPLYPMDDERRKSALKEATGTSGFLRLAQEYQAAFGTSSLNDRIRNLVPDSDYRPGDLHKRLLRLPWADVFSTNWDTLLERACTDVFDRSYDIVRTVGEIPFTMRPRIVKLHGSFPGHEPFIFTEEEYRTYPARFSPFVNLVQQSMMETIFCLVGFSGDDPNFLHWSGWVRDNLGAGAPRIYLVGWLELSSHRRRMLEARNVMAVDLSALPDADKWPPDLRHRYATEWFIATLELGKSYEPTRWPHEPDSPPVPPAYLGSIPGKAETVPLAEPPSRSWKEARDVRENALRAITGIWAHNRRLYPGWLVAPEHVRRRLQHSFFEWQSEFTLLPALAPLERLKVLCELAWRMDRALLPFSSNLENDAYSALDTLDRPARTIDGASLAPTENWADIQRSTDTLALALARNARHAGDRGRFDRALNYLKPKHDHDAEIRNAIAYEECLWDLGTGDLTGLQSRLDSWITAQGENVWSLRKAGLLAEMEDDARACSLLETTLLQIRRARRRDVDDLVSLSLEGWALFLALAYSEKGFRRTPVLPKDMPEPFERWRSLGLIDCNAFDDYQTLKRVLEAETPPRSDITMRRGFDLDHVGTTHHLGRGPSPRVIAAYEMVMLSELTGLPPSVNNMNLVDDGLKAAAKILASEEPWLAIQLAMRTKADSKLQDDIFSRVWIARLPEQLVGMLLDALLKRVDAGVARSDRSGGQGRDGLTMTASALEMLSRVAVRLNPSQLRQLLDTAMTYYRTPTFRRMAIMLGTPLAHLIARVLESLPRADILDVLLTLFDLPLPQGAGDTSDEQRWEDPVSLLPAWLDDPFDETVVRSPSWEPVISHLIQAAQGASATNRMAAIGRLFKLHQWKMLNESEMASFAAALWAQLHRNSLGLPDHTGLRAWVLLIMPEEFKGQAKEALLKAVDIQALQDNGKLNVRLAEIGEILRQLHRLGFSFEISPTIQQALTKMIVVWAEHRVSQQTRFGVFSRDQEESREALEGVSAILSHIPKTEDLMQKVWSKVSAMDQDLDGDTPGFALYPVLASLMPEKAEELVEQMHRALLSDQQDRIRAVVATISKWIGASHTSGQPCEMNLDPLVREIGIGIAARRLAILRPGLAFAEWVFRASPEPLRALLLKYCDQGLTALLEEASYSRSEQTLDIPAIRAACIRLASAMATAGFADERGVAQWLACAKDDPLPEVRNAEARRPPEQST